MDKNTVAELAAGIARVEQRQAAYEIVAHKILGCLEVHNEKIDLILKEMLREPGPSPTTAVLTEILGTMKHQAELLEGMNDAEMTPLWDEDGPDAALDKEVAR